MAEINNLGTVGASIEIDVSQLQQAAQKITQIAEQIDTALSSVGSEANPQKTAEVYKSLSAALKEVAGAMANAFKSQQLVVQATQQASTNQQAVVEATMSAAMAQSELNYAAQQTVENLSAAAAAAQRQNEEIKKSQGAIQSGVPAQEQQMPGAVPAQQEQVIDFVFDEDEVQAAGNAFSQFGARIEQVNRDIASSIAQTRESLRRILRESAYEAEQTSSAESADQVARSTQSAAAAQERLSEAAKETARNMKGAAEAAQNQRRSVVKMPEIDWSTRRRQIREMMKQFDSPEDEALYNKILQGLRAIRQEEEAIYRARSKGTGGYNETLGKAQFLDFIQRMRQTAAEMVQLLRSREEQVSAIQAAQKSEQRYAALLENIAQIESTLTELKHRRTSVDQEEVQTLKQSLSAMQEQLKIQERIVKEKRNRVLLLQQAQALERGNIGQAAAMQVRMRWDRDYDFPQERPTMGSFIQFGVLPYSMLAGQLGASGLQQFFDLTGAFAGVADSIGPMSAQLQRLSDVLKTQTGIVGTLAQAGYSLLIPFGALAAKLGAVLAVIAPLALVFAGVAIILNKLQEAEQKRQEQLRRSIELYNLSTSSAAEMTSAQIREEMEQRNRLLSAQWEFLYELEEIEAGFRSLDNPINRIFNQGVFSELDRRARDLGFENAEQAASAAGQLRQEIHNMSQEITALERALESNAVAINNNIEEMSRNDQAIVRSMELRRQFSEMTLQQIRREIEQRDIEVEQTVNLFNQVNLEETRRELTERIRQLSIERAALLEVIYSGEAFQNTLKTIEQTFNEVMQITREFEEQESRIAEERRRQSARDLEDLMISRGRQFQDIMIERARAREDRERELAKRLADLQKQDKNDIEKAEKEKAKLRLDYRKAELKAAEDLMRALRKIYEDGRINILEAAARLDARGVFEAQRRMQQQIREAMERAMLEGRDRGQQVRERIAEIDRERQAAREERWKAFKEQLQDEAEQERIRAQRRAQDFMIQLRRENEDRALRLRRQQEDFAIEDALRRQEFNRRVMQTMMQNEAIANIVRGGLNLVQGAFAQFFGNLTQMAQRLPGVNGTAMVIGNQRAMPNQPVSVSIGDIVVNATTNASPGQIGQAVRNTILYEGVGDELLRRFYGRAVVTR